MDEPPESTPPPLPPGYDRPRPRLGFKFVAVLLIPILMMATMTLLVQKKIYSSENLVWLWLAVSVGCAAFCGVMVARIDARNTLLGVLCAFGLVVLYAVAGFFGCVASLGSGNWK